jgi:tetratricopeptide (TPR) repeat protein
MTRATSLTAIGLIVTIATTVAAQDHTHSATALDKLGTVHFPTSCSAAAQPQFDHSIALLHSFEFARAIKAFGVTLKTDPTCAMAEWGIALSMWTNPMSATARQLSTMGAGRDAVGRALALGPKTERERAYIDAVSHLFTAFETTAQSSRVAAYRDAMASVAAKYPDDTEATIFYALSLTAAASPGDKAFADQLKAGAILEGLFAKQPNHPGLAHYIIHTYDAPPLAARAVDAAGRYSKIAPSAPHALHMPSHTYTRVGYWQQSIDANVAAAAAAKAEGATAEELHASDYQVYAYLQTGQDAAARRVLNSLPEIETRFDPAAIGGAASGAGGIFALAAIPARYALERGDWTAAAQLTPRTTMIPYTEAMTYFARAIGASHTGEMAIARQAVDSLRAIQQRLATANDVYWAEQVRIQLLGASAWVAHAEGLSGEALELMRAAADAEDRTEKGGITPGPLAPARELLGEMLLRMKEPALALVAFEATLAKEPDRFRALSGAALTAERGGDQTKAKKYFARIVAVCSKGDTPGRAELVLARQR